MGRSVVRVFLSHTSEFRRFPQARSFVAAAEDAVLRSGGVPSDMAYFAARDTEPAQSCVDEVRFRAKILDAGLITATFATPDQINARLPQALTARLDMVPAFADPVVARPVVLDEITERLCANGNTDVVALTAVAGTGGFGKTAMAKLAGRDPRVRQRFPDGTLWVELGAHVAGAELAAKVNDLSLRLSGDRPLFTDPVQAGQHLVTLLGSCPAC